MTIGELHAKYQVWFKLGFQLKLRDIRPGVPVAADVDMPNMPWCIPFGMEVVKVLRPTSEEIEFDYWGWHFRCTVSWKVGLVTVSILSKEPLDAPIIYDSVCLGMLIELAGMFGEDISRIAIPNFQKINMGGK